MSEELDDTYETDVDSLIADDSPLSCSNGSSYTKSSITYYYEMVKRESLTLNKEEQDKVLTLFSEATTKEEKAKYIETICKSNLKLVFKIAKAYAFDDDSLMLYISAGNEGLLKAIHNYQIGKAPFPNYAPHWIRQRILQEIYTSSQVKVPMWRVKAFIKIKLALNDYTANNNGRAPTDDELVKMTDLKVKNIKDLRYDPYLTKILNRALDDEECPIQSIYDESSASTPHLHTPSDHMIDTFDLHEIIRTALCYLTVEQRFVLKAYFGFINDDPKTLVQVAGVLGKTQERIRQIRNQALSVLRKIFDGSSIDASHFR